MLADCVAIALSPRHAIAATDMNYLRFYSTSGIQTFIMSLTGGPVVCLSACDEDLMAVTNDHGRQGGMDVLLMGIESRKIISHSPIALTPNTELKWIGFSDQGVRFCQSSADFMALDSVDL